MASIRPFLVASFPLFLLPRVRPLGAEIVFALSLFACSQNAATGERSVDMSSSGATAEAAAPGASGSTSGSSMGLQSTPPGSSHSGSDAASGAPVEASSGGLATDAAGAGATAQDASSLTPGLTDPGSSGDGNFTIGPMYTSDPSNQVTSVPQGHQIHYDMLASQSTIYPGIAGQTPYTREVVLYVPQQYVPGTPAPFIVVQDGTWEVWLGRDPTVNPDPTGTTAAGNANLPAILDNLIAAKKLPPIVALFVANGGGDSVGSERGLEYDTVSGLYAQFVQTEVLPRAAMEAKTQLDIDLEFTQDPEGRMTLGGSSGGAASFSMAWWHPEYFNRVITFSGTFVNQVPASSPFPHGCWVYHDVDPYDADAATGLIVQHCAGAPTGCATPLSKTTCEGVGGCTWVTSGMQPLRMWLETAQNDMGAGSGPSSYRDFRLANQRMALALETMGYHYHFDYALSAGHLDGDVVAQTLPSALLYVWRGYPSE